MPSPDLSGVYVKLDRARSHLNDFDAQSRPVIDACRKALTCEYDEKQSEYVIRLAPVPEVPSDLSAIIGDAIHNLRVSLDHLAWQLVITAGKTPNRDTSFPVLKKRPKPDASGLSLPDVKPGLPATMRKLIDELQPYHLNYPANHDLAMIHWLDINDKHHQLLMAVVGIRNNTLAWFGDLEIKNYNPGPYDRESEVCRYTSSAGNAPSMGFAVRVADPEAGKWGEMLGASDLARRGLAYIEQEVIPRFT